MKKSLLLFIVFYSTGLFGQAITANQLIENGMAAMGANNIYNELGSIKKAGKGHAYLIDQSVRPEGPFAVSYMEFVATIFPQSGRSLFTKMIPLTGGRMVPLAFVIDNNLSALYSGKRMRPFGEYVDEELYLSPEYVLRLAKQNNARYEKDTVVTGVRYNRISFLWEAKQVKIYFSTNSGLPSIIEITRQYYDDVPFMLGDVKKMYRYSNWQLVNNQLHYPFQRDVYINNLHWQSAGIDSVLLNTSAASDTLIIADSTKMKLISGYQLANVFNPVQLSSKEIFKDIYLITGPSTMLGSYNAAFINTPEGIVVLEAPLTSGYSKSVLAEIARVLPGKKIIGVINTSDAWPHISGLREYVARKIPVYAMHLNVPIINRLLTANFSTINDSLQKKPVKPDFKAVKGKTIIGKGENRIEIYPSNTETGERMPMVYFPKDKLLHTADLIQSPWKLLPMLKQYLLEIKNAIEREKLEVETVFGMHIGPSNYQDLLKNL